MWQEPHNILHKENLWIKDELPRSKTKLTHFVQLGIVYVYKK